MYSFNLQKKFNKIWYRQEKGWLFYLLTPLSFIYKIIIHICAIFRQKPTNNPVPVVVVGNLTVGGSGKTPAIIALIHFAQQQGLHPGVISRGYPLRLKKSTLVTLRSSPAEVGDEPLLIFNRTQVPVCVGRDRVASIQILTQQKVDLIFSDDGLQNFSFKHDLEIIIYDRYLGFGNQQLLPKGPLREPLHRLQSANFIFEKQLVGENDLTQEACLPIENIIIKVYPLRLSYHYFISLPDWKINKLDAQVPADYFKGKKVFAVTAIAHPENFFACLEACRIKFEPIFFIDHYSLSAKDFSVCSSAEIIMTEKDAIKCLTFANKNFWCLPLRGELSKEFEEKFKNCVDFKVSV